MSDNIDKYPWTAFAKYAGIYDFRSGGCEVLDDVHFFAVHLRACSVWGESALPDQLTVVTTHAGDPQSESDTDVIMTKILSSAQRRIAARKIGLLLRLYSWPTGFEFTFRCTDARLAEEIIRPLVQGVPGCVLSTLHDPEWKEPIAHATRACYISSLRHSIQHAAKSPEPLRKDHPATTSVRAFRSWVRKHPPRCAQGLVLEWVDKPIRALNEVAAAFDAHHPLGRECRVWCHASDGHRTGPIHFQWHAGEGSAEVGPTLFFDSAVHGYDAETTPGGRSAHPRGQGVGTPICCAKCKHEWHTVRLIFDYSSTSDHTDEAADFPVHNYFDALRIETRCASCGRKQLAFMITEV